jgi:hypothetical protein
LRQRRGCVVRATPGGDEITALAREVALVTTAPGAVRPGGTLVRAALATVALDDARTGRKRALAHPLMARARDAWQAGRCRRETPVACREPDGLPVEGVLDIAFEEADGRTVVDFKTGTEMAGELGRYRRLGGALRVGRGEGDRKEREGGTQL